jgi:hypothetical protein
MDTMLQDEAMIAGHTELSSWLVERRILGVYDKLLEVCLLCCACPVLTARFCQLGVHTIANLKQLEADEYSDLRRLEVSAFSVKALKAAIADGASAFVRGLTCTGFTEPGYAGSGVVDEGSFSSLLIHL